MPMDLQHEERLTKVEERSKSNSHRLDEMEKRQDNLDDLVSTVKVLAVREEAVEADVKEIKTDVKSLTSKPAQRWDSLIDKIIMTVAAAVIGFILANRGKRLAKRGRVIPAEYTRYVNAILMTCGMYDGSGEFALRVGIPAKSGVGGGIMGVAPTKMGIGIYSPSLDEKGNSVAGIHLLEKLSNQLYLSIF